MSLLLGKAKPMSHQLDDVATLEPQSRVNIWNGLGTGKMFTGSWLTQRWWMRGRIDCVVVVAPSMCFSDWESSFLQDAFPPGMCEVHDARPPDQGIIEDILTSPALQDPSKLHVIIASYGSMRGIVGENTGSRYKILHDSPMMRGLRGRRVASMFDEAQAAALQTSQQGHACRAFADACHGVISMTATPIGNPLAMRLWGMATLVRPDILRHGTSDFIAFKARYGQLVDPVQQRSEGRAPFVAARAYPVSVHDDLIQAEVLKPMAPFTVRRTKESCLDLPPKVRLRRSYRAPPEVQRLLDGLIEEDRAILSDGQAVVVANALEERLRTLELASGWLADRTVHPLKLRLLEEVIDEIDENIGKRAPIAVWCSRTRELLACALVCAGVPAEEAQRLGTVGATNDVAYSDCVRRARDGRVGVIHGRTQVRERDRIQADWKAGLIRTVVAHPGVAGAGLNWQHVEATAYFSQPLGTISRQQSEDRVHRHGLKHTALYYDLVMEDGADLAVALAHARQESASQAMLDWIDRRSRSLRA